MTAITARDPSTQPRSNPRTFSVQLPREMEGEDPRGEQHHAETVAVQVSARLSPVDVSQERPQEGRAQRRPPPVQAAHPPVHGQRARHADGRGEDLPHHREGIALLHAEEEG